MPHCIRSGHDIANNHHTGKERESEFPFVPSATKNLSAPLSTSSARPCYNLSTSFLVDCLRHGLTVPLQPLDGELYFHIKEGERVMEDIESSVLQCSMTMALPSNRLLLMEWDFGNIKYLGFRIADIRAKLLHLKKLFDLEKIKNDNRWDRKVFINAGILFHMDLIVFNTTVRQAHYLHLSFSLVDQSTVEGIESAFWSPWTGYVQSRGFDGQTRRSISAMDVWTEIRGPPGMIAMISVPSFFFHSHLMFISGVLSFHTQRHGGHQFAMISDNVCINPFFVYKPAFFVNFLRPSLPFLSKGFRALFSFHEERATLQKMSRRQWNCSVAHWSQFSLHFPCNLYYNCVDGTDEVMCPYTSPRCGPGQFLTVDRCYTFTWIAGEGKISWSSASRKCQEAGGGLVSLNSLEDWYVIVCTLYQFRRSVFVHIGMRTALNTVPQIYGKAMQLMDNNIAYYFYTSYNEFTKPLCIFLEIFVFNTEMKGSECNEKRFYDYVCEIGPAAEDTALPAGKKKPGGVLKTSSTFTLRKGSAFNSTYFAACPDGHLTHVFLACDAQSACWAQRGTSCSAPLTPLPPSFLCGDGLQHVPYTLVCDFRPDCNDMSDERFCDHLPCDLNLQFECQKDQCIGIDKMCDRVKDCLDGSDEVFCSLEYTRLKKTVVTGPAYVNFSNNGQFNLVPLNPTLKNSQHTHGPSQTYQCPDLYYGCGSSHLCFPVYTRCNEILDCPGREDESGCDGSYKCPGLFRCRGSTVCVGPSEICDGIYHCPQYDDELVCDLFCPATCKCLGLAFFCRNAVLLLRPDTYRHLRYLDASGSGLQPNAVANNTMLIHLIVARCGLTELEPQDMPNLHGLDLSGNFLTDIIAKHLSKMPNLMYLNLAGNPLTSIFAHKDGKSSAILSSRMRYLDLSGVIITQLDMADLSIFPELQFLNLSDCRLDTIQGSGLQAVRGLRMLDVRGCPLTEFEADFFSSLSALEELSADNYKLCCPQILPSDFNLARCKAPSDEISSCDNLLHSNVYRVFLALSAGLALSGNIVVFVSRVVLTKARNGFEIFTTMLCASDFLMGIYLTIIGVADRLYMGSYLWNDVTWKRSISCGVAGFLSMVSNEVSAIVICLITLDRFLVLRFPFSSVRFNRTSGIVVSFCVWLVCVVLASVPLLPPTAHWEFYAVNGICVPLPITRKDFPGQLYSFSIMIVFNFILFIVVALGQAFIYISVQKNSLRASCSNLNKSSSRDLTLARRLILIAVTDFLCWFPIGLLGILATSGVSISGEMNVAMAIFVLPLNSVINPFLYTVNRMLETRRVKTDQLLKQVKHQADHSRSPASAN